MRPRRAVLTTAATTRTVAVKGGQIATQAFGAPGDPALVLIMGATASMLGWPDALCAALAQNGLFVIRFDHRDTGRSTTLPPGEPAYCVEDMADDVNAILTAHALPTAALMGMSLGGYIAQMLAVEHPATVDALVLLGTEPLGWDGPELPHMSEPLQAHFARLATLDLGDSQALRAFLRDTERLCAGTGHRFDAAAAAARIEAILARTTSPASMLNHTKLSVRDDWTGRFRAIACPVLVIHGAEDPVLPLANGRALADGIADAELLVLGGVGHEIPAERVAEIARRVAAHVRRAAGRRR